jgi:hypothetical protein
LARTRRIDLLLRHRYTGAPDRNRFGAIVYEPHGTATVPRALTQAFTNGELWAISTEMFARWRGDVLIPCTNVGNIFGRVLQNFVELSRDSFGNGWPTNVVLGGVGLTGMRLGVGPNAVGLIHQDELEVRRELRRSDLVLCPTEYVGRRANDILPVAIALVQSDRGTT